MAGIGVLCRMKGSLFGSYGANVFCNRAPQVMHQSVLGMVMKSKSFKLGLIDKPKKATKVGLYVSQVYKQLTKENPDKAPKELIKIAVQSYKEISDEEEAKLKDLLCIANKNYQDAMKKYRVFDNDERAVLSVYEAETLIKKATRSDVKPYQLFRKDRMQTPEIRALKPAEQEKKIAEEWNSAPVNIRKKYKDAYVREVSNCIKASYDLIFLGTKENVNKQK